MEFQLSSFKSWKMMLWKCCTQYASKFGKPAAATGLEKVSSHSHPKEGNAKQRSNYRTIALISHPSKVILKILQARLQQYINCELPDFQAGFRKGSGTREQIANICWIIKKAREFQKNIYFCFIDYAISFDCVDHNKLWKILKEMGKSDHMTCLLRNLYAGQEATVRTGHGTTDWFQIGYYHVNSRKFTSIPHSFSSCDNQKCLQTWPNVPLGLKSTLPSEYYWLRPLQWLALP